MRLAGTIYRIRKQSDFLAGLSDAELRTKSLALKHDAMCGQPMNDLIVHGFPLVLEAVRRVLKLQYHDEQILGGIDLVRGLIIEMKTGEGKTLTSVLAAYLLALCGQGIHLVTFNDYLAERDCEEMKPIFALLGLTVGVLRSQMLHSERVKAYRCDVTYGAAKEFGFDFLRDRIHQSAGQTGTSIMRGMHYAIVDEADSILIDEARTPLVIGIQNPSEAITATGCFRWAAQFADLFQDGNHYRVDASSDSITLTTEGILLARSLPQSEAIQSVSILEMYDYLQKAIRVRRSFIRDKHYAIKANEVVIIDEYTGRIAEGRQWQNGIHQSIQAKEGLPVTTANRQSASITIQSFFKRYRMFCGMTGTAWTSRREIRKVYKKRVVRIPTHRPIQRAKLGERVFADCDGKFEAVACSAQQMTKAGRAVLIGTRSVYQSERLASHLAQRGLEFQILNAHHLQNEAVIIGNAGQKPLITIATNMAGRGTDIKLADEVRSAGGLHVILTEIHESERIDWQLIGRASRQGDPGSFQVFVSLDDEILESAFGSKKILRLRSKYLNHSELPPKRIFRLFRKAQRVLERRYLTDRLILMRHDIDQEKAYYDMGQDPFLQSLND